MIQLGQTNDGRLVIASNQPIPSTIRWVGYDRAQKTLSFTFEDENAEEMVLPHEISRKTSDIIKENPDVIVIAPTQKEQKPTRYISPLIQLGV